MGGSKPNLVDDRGRAGDEDKEENDLIDVPSQIVESSVRPVSKAHDSLRVVQSETIERMRRIRRQVSGL